MGEGVRERSGEALKRMEKGKSSGPSKVSCERFSNDMCVSESCVE